MSALHTERYCLVVVSGEGTVMLKEEVSRHKR